MASTPSSLPDSRRVRAESLWAPSCPTPGVIVPAPSLYGRHPCPPPGVIVSAPSLSGRRPCPIPGVFARILFGLQLCHRCPNPGVIVSAPSLYGRHPLPDSRRDRSVPLLPKEGERERAHVILIKPCPTQGLPAPSLFRLQLRPPCPIPGVFAPILFGHQLCHPCPTPGVLALSSVHSVLRARLQACPNAAPSLFGRPLDPPGPTPGVT